MNDSFYTKLIPYLSEEQAARLYYELQLSRNISGGISTPMMDALSRREEYLGQSLNNTVIDQQNFSEAVSRGMDDANTAQNIAGLEVIGGAAHTTSAVLSSVNPQLRAIHKAAGSTENMVGLMNAYKENKIDEGISNAAELGENIPKVGGQIGLYGNVYTLGKGIENNNSEKVTEASLGLASKMADEVTGDKIGILKDGVKGLNEMKEGVNRHFETSDLKKEVSGLGKEGLVNNYDEIKANIFNKYENSIDAKTDEIDHPRPIQTDQLKPVQIDHLKPVEIDHLMGG